MSMLDYLIQNRKQRPATWIHGCRGYKVHAFREVVKELGQKYGEMSVHTFYDRIEQEVEDGYYEGFVDLSRLSQSLAPGADYYICGPGAFIKKHFAYLSSQGIAREAIHFEEFGPATLAVE
jgi:nitric oxide dioxygenase